MLMPQQPLSYQFRLWMPSDEEHSFAPSFVSKWLGDLKAESCMKQYGVHQEMAWALTSGAVESWEALLC